MYMGRMKDAHIRMDRKRKSNYFKITDFVGNIGEATGVGEGTGSFMRESRVL